MWDLSSYPASARGLLLYNILTAGSSNPSDGANLGQYITGATPEEKIATLSRIFTIPNYNDLAESKGLFALASNSDEIDSNNLNINDFNAVTESRSALTSSMRIATDAFGDSTNIRSYFASEIISSLLDQFMEIQYDVIDGFTYYYEEVHFGASSYLDIDEDVYNNVSFAECDGLNGAFDTILIINKIMSETIFPNQSELINTFTLMDNSQASKILYLARAHNNLGTITQTVPPTWSDYTANVYVPGFLFSTYGNIVSRPFCIKLIMQTVQVRCEETLEVNKSKFVAIILPSTMLIILKKLLAEIKKEHTKAKHIVYAYRVKDKSKSCDDQEPKGTGLELLHEKWSNFRRPLLWWH